MKTDVIIQARIGSSRLPKKILKRLPYNSEYTILDQVIRRVSQSKNIDDIIIATTNEPDSEKIVDIAKKNNIKFHKGSLHNVLERYYQSAKKFGSERIVRVTSDSPCIDWTIIDEMIQTFEDNSELDYISNTLERTFPHGFDAEVFSFAALETAYHEATEDYEIEHVTPYIYKSGKFSIKSFKAKPELNFPKIRITVDTMEDYTLVCSIYDYLFERKSNFSAMDIIKLLEDKPWLIDINKKIVQKKVNYSTLIDEITEAIKVLKLQDLDRVAKLLENIEIPDDN